MFCCPGCGGVFNPIPGQPIDGFGCRACGAVKPYCGNCKIFSDSRPDDPCAVNVAAASKAFAAKHAASCGGAA